MASLVSAQSAANPQELTWDPGVSEQGTQTVAQPTTGAGTFYYRINTRAAEVWRTRLTVTSGEANLYLRRGSVPVKGQAGTIASELQGNDGTVLGPSDFGPGQDWFIMVEALGASSTWTLATGDAYVRDLGNLPHTDTNLDGSYTIGEPSQDGGVANLIFPPEGVLFFKTTLPSNVPAWSLWLKGGTQVMGVRKNKVPVLFGATQTVDRKQNGNLLLVPPYLGLGSDSYFVSVVGLPGTSVSLDSRIQQIEDMAFDSAIPPFTVTGSPYRVFRVDVPAGLTVWDVSLSRLSGDPSLAVKKESVPCETENDAVSEALGEANDSVSLVSPYLTNGKWFVTVYSPLAYETGVSNGEPVVSDVGFRAEVDNDQPSRAGWKYYRVPDFASQVGTLGWQLNLTNAQSGTQLAIRRAQVPGSWKRRTGGSTNLTTVSYNDALSSNGILQRVDHEADIWYVGVYQPDKELGNFHLELDDILATQTTWNGSESVVANQIDGEWRYFRIVVPDDPNLLGWYLDLTAVTGAATPKIYVRRDRLPPATLTPSSSGWTTGTGVTADLDFTGVMTDPSNLAVNGQRFLSIKGPGRQLEPGTYYVGVLAGAAVPAAGSTNTASYILRSRGIGAGFALEVTPLALNGGSLSTGPLAARDFRFFSVTIPEGANVPGVRLSLSPTAGEMLMQVRRESLPDFTTSAQVGGSPAVTGISGGKRMKRTGAESLVIAPENGASTVYPGTYYIAAISEGVAPTTTVMGTGSATGTLSSHVPVPVMDLGTLSASTPVAQPFDLVGGDMAIYTFTVPAGMKVLEASLSERVGNPGISMLRGTSIPIPFPGNNSGNNGYGWVGGQTVATHPVLLTEQDPVAGQFTLVVRANASTSGLVQGTGVLNIRLVETIPALHLLNGPKTSVVSGQVAEGWKYFELTVPNDSRIKGIRVSLKDVSSGVPRMVIRKGTKMPKDFVTSSGLGSSATSWAVDQQWAPTKDFTNLPKDSSGVIASGRYFLAAYGAPMDAGTYIIGVSKDSSINTVSNPSTPNMSYRVVVEAIGDTIGDGFDLPITTIAYDNTATPEQIVDLPERDIKFYKVTVPANCPSWRVQLQSGLSQDLQPAVLDGGFAVRRGKLPAFDAALDPFVGGGANVRMIAVDDHWVLLPTLTTGVIEQGDYFIAVTAFGKAPKTDQTGPGPCSLTLLSRGTLPVATFPTLLVDDPVALPYNLGPGEVAAYQLTVPPPGVDGVPYGLVLDIGRLTGSANYSIRLIETNGLGFPVPPGKGSDGFSGGLTALSSTTDDIGGRIFFEIPVGTYRVIVRSSQNVLGTYGPASGILSASLLVSSAIPTVAFDGGNLSVTNAGPATDFLQYRVVVPDEPNWVGWGLRLDTPVAGKPQVYIRRGSAMETPLPPSVNSDMIDWPLGHQWTQIDDFTKLRHDPPAPVSSGGDKDRQYQYFFAARERPLQPGTYFIGVDNRSTAIISPRSFTIRTFAVGDGYSIPLGNLSGTGTTLPVLITEPRMPAAFRLTIPPNSRGWSVALSPSLGDMTLRVRFAGMPDPVNETNSSPYPDTKGGVHIQKSGDERFTILPKTGQDYLEPGDYYLVAASDGQGPVPASLLIGTGQVEGTITNLGPLAVTSLGSVSPTGISQPVSLAAAEVQAFTVEVPPGINNLQFRLNNRNGDATIAVLKGTRVPDPRITTSESYGVFGGEATASKGTIINLGNPAAGTYTIAVRAAGTGSSYTAASATLVIGEVKPISLNFAEEFNAGNGLLNSDRRTLADKEKFFYKVPIPRQVNGQDVLGWLLVLDQGTPIVRIYKSADDFGKTAPVTITSGRRSALVVPPFLTFDTNWYIEVEGVGTSDYILRSQPVVLSAPAWTMPSAFNVSFGDSNPGSPDGQGIGRVIAQDMWDFFAIDVPSDNLGLLRTVLEQYNGNPNVYIGFGGIPSPDHLTGGTTGTKIFRYKMTDTASEVGNFSELSNSSSPPDKLSQGRWYIGVKAENVSSTYRLKAHSGVVTDLNLTTAVPLAGQDLAAKDWRYYRFTVPRTGIPAQWNPFFERVSGSSVAYIRDTLPPFSYDSATGLTPAYTFVEWGTDSKNKVATNAYVKAVGPGTLSLAPCPLRPGSTYFLGFYGGNSGGGLNVSSSVSGGTVAIDAESPWNTGVIQIAVPANQSRLVRVSTDPDATRLKILTEHSAVGMSVKLEQGAPPSTATGVAPHLQNTTQYPQTFLINQSLVGQAWPWYPGKDYYLRLTNTTNQDIVSTLTMQGRSVATEDEDQDELLDAWERLYFSAITAQGANGDPDGDGSTNLQEQQNGTSPVDSTSVRYLLSVLAPGGGLGIVPLQPHYAAGSLVSLTATPAAGDIFREWKSSDALMNGSTNPVQSTIMTANRTATAIFQTSLAKALDTPISTVWATTGSASGSFGQWYGQYEVHHDGDAAVSPAIGPSQQSRISTSFQGPGTLTFWWKVSSKSGSGILTLMVDNIAQPGAISGITDWAKVTIRIEDGTRPIPVAWRYNRTIDSATAGENRAFVDEVQFVPDNQPVNDFATWKSNNFTSGELANPAVSGPTADPDGDRIPNMIEAAIGSLPKSKNPPGYALELEETSTAGGQRINILRARRATDPILDIRLEILASMSLQNGSWSPLATKTGAQSWVESGPSIDVTESPDAVSMPVRLEESVPEASSPARFFRLQATQVQP